MKMNPFDKLSWLLVTVGALNWGSVGFFDYNAVDRIFGAGSTGARVVYDIVGLAAVWSLWGMLTMMSSANSDKK